ncbi:hypothetical protein NQ317_015622, partial [Molorchus minor]
FPYDPRFDGLRALSKGQGKLSRSCPNNISINSHKKHGRWNEKMAETGQEEGKQNIRIEGALLIRGIGRENWMKLPTGCCLSFPENPEVKTKWVTFYGDIKVSTKVRTTYLKIRQANVDASWWTGFAVTTPQARIVMAPKNKEDFPPRRPDSKSFLGARFFVFPGPHMRRRNPGRLVRRFVTRGTQREAGPLHPDS